MMIDFRQELNAEQLKVVMAPGGPLLVIAGAGSGKTRTLTYRVARLLATGTRPEEILLATFTNKAASSMLARVRELVTGNIETLWGGTFHHICHRILRANAVQAGLRPGFSILDSEDARQLINSASSELGVTGLKDSFPRANVLIDMINLSVKTERPLEEIVDERYPLFMKRLKEIEQIAAAYRAKKTEQNLVDFEDLLIKCRDVLRRMPEVAGHYANRFSHILVDEYQDTDRIQAEIVDILASRHRNVMVVGDDSQSIYAFRGANYANITEFPRRYPDCRIFKLETNYRSTPEILKLANICIRNNENQFEKNLKSVRGKGVKPAVVVARDVSQQANFVSQRIGELIKSGLPLSEMAVLYRAHFHSMELQMELTRRGIPFLIRSGIRFFEQAHIKDLVSFLKIFANPYDETAWKRILGMYDKIGPKTADRIFRFLKQADPVKSALTDGFLKSAPKGATPGLLRLQATLKSIAGEIAGKPVAEMIEEILNHGYRTLLAERYSDGASREEDLRHLANFSSKFKDLHEFLNELSLLGNLDAEEGPKKEWEEENDNRLILSTVHQAKGLEWSVVFVIWCAEGMLPLSRALKDPGGEEEERRLFYVAATRAKDQLYLAYPRLNYGRNAGFANNLPSRFISELGAPFRRSECPFDQWVLYDNF